MTGGKNDTTEAALLWTHHEKARLFGKDNNSGERQKAAEKEEDQI